MKCNGCGRETGIWYQDHRHGPRCFDCKEKIERLKKWRDNNGIQKRDSEDKGRKV